MTRFLLAAAIVAGSALTLSCNVNQYCLNCEKGDGGADDSQLQADANDGGDIDASTIDAGACVPTGDEVCDGKDNDCDGNIDEGTLPEVGDPCDNQMGECAGAVKACAAGHIVCKKGSATVPSAEVCDNKDNDCNGLVDEGDPGGGAKCGTDVGECVAGTNHCTNGVVKCVGQVGMVGGQAEQCNGKDDDCDGNFDEGLTNLGSCGVSNQGACHFGQLGCVGGGVTCVGNQDPVFEICDNIDNDCDGIVDNGFNKQTDPQNCGMCGKKCMFANANAGCAAGACTIASCQAGFHNNNGTLSDGCEYGPCFSSGTEVCNGLDDDCNGTKDDNLTPPAGLCKTAGACSGSFAMCTGSGGWKCVYPSGNVSTDINGNIIPETACDGIDNDCDGIVDNNQPNKGQACTDAKLGACQGKGTFVCNTAVPNGPAICNITMPGATAVPESCNGKDDDCDGVIDNGAATGNLPGQEWVTIPGGTTQIMKYEASRPDADATNLGTQTAVACSRAGVQPWINITAVAAKNACTSVGGRLCTETEWQNMCAREPTTTYPVNGPSGTTDYTFIEAENAQTNATVNGKTWTADTTQDFSGVRDLIALPNSGTAATAANAPTTGARLDFQINFVATGNYFVWVRVLAGTTNDNTVFTGINGAAPGVVSASPNAPTVLNKWTWVVGASTAVAATGNRIVSVYMGKDGVRVDAIAISKDGVNLPPQTKDTWAYSANTKVPQPQTCNDHEFDTGAAAGDQDDILPTGSMANCYADGGGTNRAFDMSGNAKEWTAPRSAGANPIRGGSSSNTVQGLSCQLNFTLADDSFFFPDTGFRCCR